MTPRPWTCAICSQVQRTQPGPRSFFRLIGTATLLGASASVPRGQQVRQRRLRLPVDQQSRASAAAFLDSAILLYLYLGTYQAWPARARARQYVSACPAVLCPTKKGTQLAASPILSLFFLGLQHVGLLRGAPHHSLNVKVGDERTAPNGNGRPPVEDGRRSRRRRPPVIGH